MAPAARFTSFTIITLPVIFFNIPSGANLNSGKNMKFFFKNKKKKTSGIIEIILSEPDDPVEILKNIADWLRPSSSENIETVIKKIEHLGEVLNDNPEADEAIRLILRDWLENANYFLAFAVLGIFSRKGFLMELLNRLYEHINPSPPDKSSISDALRIIFGKEKDYEWVKELPEESWLYLFKILWNRKPEEGEKILSRTISELLYALEMLSIWVAGEELEQDLVRIDPTIVNYDSAFIALQRELSSYCRNYEAWIAGEKDTFDDDSHARVLLDQSMLAVKNFRKKSVAKGIGISLSYLLERLDQTLGRIKSILDLLTPVPSEKSKKSAAEFFTELVNASIERYSIRTLVNQNIRLLSISITENTSDHGEHYITKNREDYLQMLVSGAGGGIFIAAMALIKINLTGLGLNPLNQTVLVCLNYGIGFMIIHIMHFTVATKQPAMTASKFASVLQQEGTAGANPDTLASLLIQVSRSQFIAIIGNVSVAIILSFGLGFLFLNFTGTPIVTDKKSAYLLYELTPLASLAVLHAAIAGVWLFVSGLAAGFFDNRAAYLMLGERLKHHPLLKKIMSFSAREKLGKYMDENYGALAGNFIFGVLLGATSYIGYLLNAPLGIRHVAFSSANFGYAVSVNTPGYYELLLSILYIILIASLNLWVSFILALNVALRSRNLKLTSFSKIMKAFAGKVREKPLSLFFPPKTEEDENNQIIT